MTIYGWDMSHYDSPNITTAVKEGYVFITHKIGGDSTDQEADDWWNSVKGTNPAQVLLGGYWVLRPDLPGSAVAKADSFIARLDQFCPGWRNRPFILQVDCERWSDPSGKKQPNRAYIDAFCDRLRVKMPKLMPIVYASAGEYDDKLKGLSYPLWNARYRLGYTAGTGSALYAKSGGDSGKGWDAYSGKVPAIWQFTSSAIIAGQTTCDANAFRGTLAQLIKLVAPGWVPTEPTKPVTPSEELPVDAKTFNSLFLGALKDPAIRVEVGKAMLEASGWSEGFSQRKISQHANDEQVMRNFLYGKPDKDGQQIPADSPIAKVVRAAEVTLGEHGPGTVHTS
jgi:GH25 family lysozyme M1 (1,4-beta-N-acetylmuramidase)